MNDETKAASTSDKPKAAEKKAERRGPLVKEAIHHDGKLYAPGDHLPADTDAAVIARQEELGNI